MKDKALSLRDLHGARHSFTATVASLWWEGGRKNKRKTRVLLLRDLATADGARIEGRVTMNTTAEIAALEIKSGDALSFGAMVSAAIRGRDSDPEGRRWEYALRRPSKARVL